jgi:predicted nuclease of predicted toxin-antitoxin system
MPWKIVPELSDEEASQIDAEIKKKARFLVDENMGIDVANVIRGEGFNTLFVEDVNLHGHSDEDLFGFAWKDNRVLLTHDTDFLNDQRFPLNRCPGVVVLPGGSTHIGDIDDILSGLLILVGENRVSLWHQKIHVSDDHVWTMKGWAKSGGFHYRNRYKFGPNGELWIWEDHD